MILQKGDFVRVKASSLDRPNQDGMVATPGDGQVVGLLFGCDRHGQSPSALGITCTGFVEAWDVTELDLSTVEH